MSKNILVALTGMAILMVGASAAHAADGTIDITGSISGNTCVINGGASAKDFTVALPPVATSALAVAGSNAGRTPFQIALTNCAPDTGKVSAYFEAGPSVNTTSGRLVPDAGGATKVEVGVLNDTFGHIQLGAAYPTQNSQIVDISGGAANLNYYAQYESLGGATAGAVKTRVQYSLVYQ